MLLIDRMDAGSARVARAMVALVGYKHHSGDFDPEVIFEPTEDGHVSFDGQPIVLGELFTAALAMTELLLAIRSKTEGTSVSDEVATLALLLAASEDKRGDCPFHGGTWPTRTMGEDEEF